MAEPMTAERLEELLDDLIGAVEFDCTELDGDERSDETEEAIAAIKAAFDAMLRAAEERDKARADLHALRTALVEATMEPFDIGPCYIAGPLPLKQKHDGEAFAVQHERMLGVFGQLLDRVEAKAAGTTEACNRVWRERARLRAQRDALVRLVIDMRDNGDRWTGPRASSHYRSEIFERIEAALRAAKENQ